MKGVIPDAGGREREFYELALKCSGAVQAARWTDIADGTGYIYSFNGPHSLFADTIRSLRALWRWRTSLGHVLMGERDARKFRSSNVSVQTRARDGEIQCLLR